MLTTDLESLQISDCVWEKELRHRGVPHKARSRWV
jgi:hypothetical protein